jgi:alpha-L-rhamnosidase
MQFGDWLDPDAPAGRPWEAKADSTYLANAFLVASARLAADAAALAGDGAWAAEARELADAVAGETWRRWADHAASTQTGCAVALRLGLVPDDERAAVADALARLVREAKGRVSSGFLGTPLVLPALSDAGRLEEAFLMLLQQEMPSWLYQVRQGATTVWERWDAVRPDGSIHPGTMQTPPGIPERQESEPHMLSFNHYAYGAVIDWTYRNLAGLAPDIERPGYRHAILAPKPVVGIDWARASVESPYGTVAIDWRVDAAGLFEATVELPFGTTATFVPPGTSGSRVMVDGAQGGGHAVLGPGRHVVSVTQARIVDPGRASSERPRAKLAS